MAFKARQIREIEFATPGEELEGRLLSASSMRFRDGGTNIDYLVRRDDGCLISFKGSSMLNKLLSRQDVGLLVRIVYRGNETQTPKEGMSPKKIFDVAVDEESRATSDSRPNGKVLSDGTQITDDDIPF